MDIINNKWIKRHISLAKHVSTWSKDPSTQVGAVIARPDNTIASIGYNGFPRGVSDTEDRLNNRSVKYELVVHAEANAIVNAREPLHGHSIFVHPFCTCSRCAAIIIQSGIRSVYFPSFNTISDEVLSRHKASWGLALDMYQEAGVTFKEIV
jgi:dCMP deaminase